MSTALLPKIQFVIGGAQKAGTSALAHYLSFHSDLRLPFNKEAHIFDAPHFDEGRSICDINSEYEAHFSAPWAEGVLYGDATPIYMLHPVFVRRVAAYNPAMRWIVILRDPVERALSQYYMERSRGFEPLPFWKALLAERGRLKGRGDDFSAGSSLRVHSYRLRGQYSCQLDCIRDNFPEEQLLILRNPDLSMKPGVVVNAVCDFLGVSRLPDQHSYPRVFEGGYRRRDKSSLRLRLIRAWWWREYARQARQGIHWER